MTTKQAKAREFWMDTDILDKALDNCDLGDGYSAKVRMYPHKDMLPQLTKVIEYSSFELSQKQVDVLCSALDIEKKGWKESRDSLTVSQDLVAQMTDERDSMVLTANEYAKEIKRLREALEKLRDKEFLVSANEEDVRFIASQALADSGGGGE